MTETLSIEQLIKQIPEDKVPQRNAFLTTLRSSLRGVKTEMDSSAFDAGRLDIEASKRALYVLKGRLADFNLPSGVPLKIVGKVEEALESDPADVREIIRQLYKALLIP